MNKWIIEPNAAIVRRIGKTAEEVNELGAVCARILIQGLDGVDPASNKTNRERLVEEMADVQAQLNQNIVALLSLEEIEFFNRRESHKFVQMDEWEALYTPPEGT